MQVRSSDYSLARKVFPVSEVDFWFSPFFFFFFFHRDPYICLCSLCDKVNRWQFPLPVVLHQIWNMETIFTDKNLNDRSIGNTFPLYMWKKYMCHSSDVDYFWNTHFCISTPPKPLIRKISGKTLFYLLTIIIIYGYWDEIWLACYFRAWKILWIK